MTKILVAFTTNARATVQAAQAASEGLSNADTQVEARPLEEATDLICFREVARRLAFYRQSCYTL